MATAATILLRVMLAFFWSLVIQALIKKAAPRIKERWQTRPKLSISWK